MNNLARFMLGAILLLFAAMVSADSMFPPDLNKALTENEKYVSVTPGSVNRVNLVIPTQKVETLLSDLKKAGFSLMVDGYDAVYMSIPWTASPQAEYSKLIFEVKGDLAAIRSWLNSNVASFGVTHHSVQEAARGMVILKKDNPKDNPNPVKWFNLTWPVTPNYVSNIAEVRVLIQESLSKKYHLEINCPLATDNLSQLASRVTRLFPQLSLIQVAQGTEHFIDLEGKEFKSPSVQLTFEISSDLTPIGDHDLWLSQLFRVIEYFHSYNVPVMRVFQVR